VLGWVFIGDSRWFRRRVDAAELEKLTRQEEAALAGVRAERDAMVRRLIPPQRQRYDALVNVCRDIETQLANASTSDFPVEKLDGLMWSFLGLLGSETNLAAFIEREIDEKFGERISELEPELKALEASIAKVEPGTAAYESRMQLLASKQESLEALRKRHQQFQRAAENLELVRAELDRIQEQLKLVRSDLYASKSVGQVSQRVNDTIDQLASSGRFTSEEGPAIKEMPAFKTRRVGYKLQSEA
jgi:DNA repair exonuclease SbcCD ATPase subunit